MKKKTAFLRALKLLVLAVIICLCIGILQKYFFVFFSDVKVRMDGFYLEDENSLDVVFVGSSELYNDFSPGLAYGEYGFTSYALGTPEGSAALWKAQLKEVLRYQDPQFIVIEINAALFDNDQQLYKDATLRHFLDNTPLSRNKITTVNALPLEDEIISYYIPFIKYHGSADIGSAWLSAKTELQMELRGYSLLKGIYTNPKAVNPDQKLIDVTNDDTTLELQPESERYLRELLDYCREEGMDNVIFARFPHRINSEEKYARFQRCNRAEQIVREYGFPFVNLEGKSEELGLSLYSDYYDNDHLNIAGQQKFTRYFSKFLMEHYDLRPGELTAEQEAAWNESYRYTLRFYDYVENYPVDPQVDTYLFETYDLLAELDSLAEE